MKYKLRLDDDPGREFPVVKDDEGNQTCTLSGLSLVLMGVQLMGIDNNKVYIDKRFEPINMVPSLTLTFKFKMFEGAIAMIVGERNA